jgi:hypothetical protein
MCSRIARASAPRAIEGRPRASELADNPAGAKVPDVIVRRRQQRDRQVFQAIQHAGLGGVQKNALARRLLGSKTTDRRLQIGETQIGPPAHIAASTAKSGQRSLRKSRWISA